jgi:hypothetical protein
MAAKLKQLPETEMNPIGRDAEGYNFVWFNMYLKLKKSWSGRCDSS